MLSCLFVATVVAEAEEAGETSGTKVNVVGWYVWRANERLPHERIRFEDLTHFVYNPEFDLLCSADGHLKDTHAIDEDLDALVEVAHRHRVKVQIMLADCPAEFAAMMSKRSSRKTFIAEVLAYVRQHKLDGVEYDWEGMPGEGPNAQQVQDYTDLLIETKRAFAGERLLVTFDGAVWKPCFITPKAIPAVDFVNIMSYQGMDEAREALKMWEDFGFPRGRIYLGVGFYGDFADVQTVRAKAKHVLEHGYGGLFCFHLNLDTDASLLKAVSKALGRDDSP